MTRGWETNGTGPGRRRSSIRPLERGADPGSRVRRIMEGHETAVGEAVIRIVAAGGGLLFSSTRDRGAVGVHIFAGDSRVSDYSSSPEDFGALLETLEEAWKEYFPEEARRQAKVPGKAP